MEEIVAEKREDGDFVNLMCWDPSLNLPLDLEGIDRLQTRWSQRGLLELCIYGARAFLAVFGSCEDGASSCVCRLELQLEESGVCSTLHNFLALGIL